MSRSPIYAYLIGSDLCRVGDLVVRHNAPVLGMCCKLVEAGYDDERPLWAFRGSELAMKVKGIGWGAQYIVAKTGNGSKPASFRPLNRERWSDVKARAKTRGQGKD